MTGSRATRLVRAAVETDAQHGAIMPPIVLSTNFSFEGLGEKRRYDYTRSGNPTRDHFADALADLESASRGVVTASGMAAIALFCQLLRPTDLLVAPHDCYGGSYRLFRALAARGAFRVEFVDFRDGDALDAFDHDPPAWYWVETPSNPLMRLTDLEALVARARRTGARVAVDNTFLTPLLQQPLLLGADLVAHSTTKYLNGHSDVVGGALLARDASLGEELEWWANCLGLSGAPFDAFLSLRGLRTLAVRMRAHEENAQRVAETLTRSDAVRAVHWPGLASHSDHELAKRQQRGFGGMISFDLAWGTAAVEAFLDGLECFSLAESLGGVESLVAHPASMTHASMDEAARRRAGIGPGLLRLSVGIEDPDDLVTDVRAALRRCQRCAPKGLGSPSSRV